MPLRPDSLSSTPNAVSDERALSRRRFLQGTILGGMLAASPAWADSTTNLGLPSGPTDRELTTAFPQKGQMILQRTRPPLLETPFEVFDRGVFTPNDQFFVRWHWAVIPQQIDVTTFRIAVRGHVNTTLALSLADILAMPRVEMAAARLRGHDSSAIWEEALQAIDAMRAAHDAHDSQGMASAFANVASFPLVAGEMASSNARRPSRRQGDHSSNNKGRVICASFPLGN